jgi:hypothetical protein
MGLGLFNKRLDMHAAGMEFAEALRCVEETRLDMICGFQSS